jgi:tetratricopeptide (TPR) repeat protein
MTRAGVRRSELPVAVAGGSLALLAALAVYVAGGPIKTADFWFHAKMGEVYLALFGVAVHLLDRTLGFPGLRAAHALAVAGILWLAWSLFRRESGSRVAACLATAVFITVAWWRLWQLRPDLVSIPAALLLYRLLLEPGGPPSWTRVSASVALLLVWANVHSLFAIGPLLLMAALAGLALRAGLVRAAGPGAGDSGGGFAPGAARARRVAAALGVGLLATLANPRGLEQHLTFFTSSRAAAIWSISDEWMHFDPFSWGHYGKAVSPLAWVVTDALLASFLAVAALGFVGVLRHRPGIASGRADPVLLGLGLASIVAILVSIRFLWMSAFVVLFLLRAGRAAVAARPAAAGAARWALALGTLSLALAFPRLGGFEPLAANVPARPSEYVATPYVAGGYHEEGVRFLEQTGVEGHLFNHYPMGGFLGYWVAPRLRTFVDGRTEHYPAEVLREYFRINRQQRVRPGESSLDALDRRRVDFFFGVGLPLGWLLVHRTLDHAIYLRANARNRENLRRIAAYYRGEGVPFGSESGLDPMAVIRARPDWAAARGMLPPLYPEKLAARASPDPEVRFRSLDTLGWVYAFLGAYADQLEVDRQAVALRPELKAARRRIVYGLLRLGRTGEAIDAARELVRLDPQDSRSATFERAAREVAAREAAGEVEGRARPPADAPINSLPLITTGEFQQCCADFL